MARKQSDTVQLKLRFPEKLRVRIEVAAVRNQRSMNSEIIHRLEQSFEKDDRTTAMNAVAQAAAAAATTAMVDKFEIVGLKPSKPSPKP
jgi:Arc-like DNA binding domain